MTISARLPASQKTSLQFTCKLCGKQIHETATEPSRQFSSRLQHLRSKQALNIHEFFKSFFEYAGGV